MSGLLVKNLGKISGGCETAQFGDLFDRDVAFCKQADTFLQADIIQIFAGRDPVGGYKQSVQRDSVDVQHLCQS